MIIFFVKIIFFPIIIRMEQLKRQNAQVKNLNRTLGAENMLLDSENRKQKVLVKKK